MKLAGKFVLGIIIILLILGVMTVLKENTGSLTGRTGVIGWIIIAGLIACVAIYYFKDLSLALGQTNRISLSLAVWIPVVTLGLFSSIGVLQINEK